MIGFFGHNKGSRPSITHNIKTGLTYYILRGRLLLTFGSCRPSLCKNIKLFTRSCEMTGQLSRAFLWNRPHFNTKRPELLFQLQPGLDTGAIPPSIHKLHVYLGTHGFQILSVKPTREWLFVSFLPFTSQDRNWRRTRRPTSWRQTHELVLLVLVKCLGFLWRQSRGWVQLCKQPLTCFPQNASNHQLHLYPYSSSSLLMFVTHH